MSRSRRLPSPQTSVRPDRADDVAFDPKMLKEAAVMDTIERLQKVVLSLTYDDSLFTDPATLGKGLAEMGIVGL